MSRRMRRPETVRLEISQGDWLLVKKYLTAGEQRQIFKHMLAYTNDKERYQSLEYAPSLVAGYLLDWSIEDADGRPVVIRDEPYDTVLAALDMLDTPSFNEIRTAIDAHAAAMEQDLAAEKNDRSGEPVSSAISPSRKRSGGSMRTSPISPSTSTIS